MGNGTQTMINPFHKETEHSQSWQISTLCIGFMVREENEERKSWLNVSN